jgi:uncharacterized repeat protein (TIGR01451 family)
MHTTVTRKLLMIGGLTGLLLLALVGLVAAPSKAAPAADKGGGRGYAASPLDVTIPGSPLSVVVRDTSSYGVYRNGTNQFYGGNAEGVYLWVNGQVWGPEAVPAGNSVNDYTPVSNSLSGDGSPGNPWVVTTVVDVGATGLQLTQWVSYVNGQDFIRDDFSLCNTGGGAPAVHLFHAADLYTGGNDAGYGYYDPASGSIGGYTQARDLYQIFIPITAATHFEEEHYSTIWSDIGDTSGQGAGFRDVYYPNQYFDNGAGLEWVFNASGCQTISDYVSFSNTPVIPTPGTPGVPTPTRVPEVRQRADVCLSLMVDADTAVAPGGIFTFTITVKNNGPGEAFGTGVRIPLDANLEVLDFHSDDGHIFVDYVGDDAVSVLFHDIGPGASGTAQVIAGVRSTATAGTKITSRATAYWSDTVPHRTLKSNSVTFEVGPTADSGLHGMQQTLLALPSDPVTAGTPVLFAGDFYGQEERISLWLNNPDGTVTSTTDYGLSDQDGILTFGIDTSGLAPGVYTIVGHGRCSNVEGVGTFTVK